MFLFILYSGETMKKNILRVHNISFVLHLLWLHI